MGSRRYTTELSMHPLRNESRFPSQTQGRGELRASLWVVVETRLVAEM